MDSASRDARDESNPGHPAQSVPGAMAPEARDHLAAIVESSDDAIISKTLQGIITTWNAAAERMFGWTCDEMVGQSVLRMIPVELQNEEPMILARLSSGLSINTYETVRLRKDGRRVDISLTVSPIRNSDGVVIGGAKIVRDITDTKRAQARLAALERRFRDVQEISPDGFCMFRPERDASGKITDFICTYQNPASRDMLGRIGGSIIDRRMSETTPEILASEVFADFVRVMRTGDVVTGEIIPDIGIFRDRIFQRTLLRAGDELAMSFRDLTPLREGENLRARHLAGLNAVSDGLLMLDADWRYTFVNPQAERLLGKSSSELLGKSLWELYPQTDTPIRRMLEAAMRERTPHEGEFYSELIHAWLEIRAYADPAGIGLVLLFRDVSEERRRREAEALVESASAMLSQSLDPQEIANAVVRVPLPDFADWAVLDGYMPDGSIGRLAFAHIDPDMMERAREGDERWAPVYDETSSSVRIMRTTEPELVADIDPEMLDASARDDKHREFLRSFTLSSYLGVPLVARGRSIGALILLTTNHRRRYTEADLAIAQEIAQRAAVALDNAQLFAAERRARADAEAAQEEMRVASRAKSDFLATMSHELRTPLNAISGHVQLMQMGIHGNLAEPQREALDRIDRASKHLLGLINDVLNFARIENGRLEYKLAPVDLGTIVPDVTALIEAQAAAREVTLLNEVDDRYRCVTADAEKVAQILLNLLGNAVKFTPPNGEVVVSTARSRSKLDMIELRVRDTGIGIPDDMLGAVFEAFVQVGRSLSSSHEGTGLGLAISRDLARGMGGELRAEHGKDGRGATFVVTLPALTV